ncbi:MAG: hypothetical protein NC121_02990 [Blautia sp.]|nr:hypothetical protein [Blautia sp.]
MSRKSRQRGIKFDEFARIRQFSKSFALTEMPEIYMLSFERMGLPY